MSERLQGLRSRRARNAARTDRVSKYEPGDGRLLFPALAGTTMARVNLDAEHSVFARHHPELFRTPDVNPVLDPRVSQRMVDEFHRAWDVDWSFGGYLEDRRHLLRGSYLSARGTFLHLGVDLNVPQGTAVAVVEESLVVLVDDDKDVDGGWGPRVFVKPSGARRPAIIQIFAHLQSVRAKPGDRLAPGTVFAEVGGPPHNGNWHPHLHLQAIREPCFRQLRQRLSDLDGYGDRAEKPALRRNFPDPLRRFPGLAA